MNHTPILTAKDLDLFYGENQALKSVTMDIPEKQITSLIDNSEIKRIHHGYFQKVF